MTRHELNVQGLAATVLFAAKADQRYYLTGVALEVGSQDVFTVATNGHVLGAYLHDDAGVDAKPGTYIIPREAVDNAVKAAKKAKLDTVPVEVGEGQFTFHLPTGTVQGALMDAQYPDWRRTLPREVSGAHAHIDAKYWTLIHNVEKALGRGPKDFPTAVCYPNGTGTSLFLFKRCPAFMAIIMPFDPDVYLLDQAEVFTAATGVLPRMPVDL